MPLARKLSDFTAVARSSLQEAIDDDTPLFLPQSHHGTPEQMFIGHLAYAPSLRYAARRANLNRPRAKEVLRLVARAAIQHQRLVFQHLASRESCQRQAWAFSAKNPQASRKLNKQDLNSVWTHVWVDDDTRLIRRWLVGPGVALLAENQAESAALNDHTAIRAWIDDQPAGLARRIDLHGQAVSFFVACHNLCGANRDGRSPAMLSGIADRLWTPHDVASLAF